MRPTVFQINAAEAQVDTTLNYRAAGQLQSASNASSTASPYTVTLVTASDLSAYINGTITGPTFSVGTQTGNITNIIGREVYTDQTVGRWAINATPTSFTLTAPLIALPAGSTVIPVTSAAGFVLGARITAPNSPGAIASSAEIIGINGNNITISTPTLASITASGTIRQVADDGGKTIVLDQYLTPQAFTAVGVGTGNLTLTGFVGELNNLVSTGALTPTGTQVTITGTAFTAVRVSGVTAGSVAFNQSGVR